MKDVFLHFGMSNVIRSGNGRCYDSKEFRQFAEKYGFVLKTSSPRYPASNGLAESAVKTVKRLWSKSEDRDVAMTAYRTTPLSSGYSPSELMFGRPIRSSLGISYESDIDYGQFEENETQRKDKIKSRWDKKYRVAVLPKLEPGQIVYVNAPSDSGTRGIVLREDTSPDSYWVRVGQSEIRRNRKHLFLLHPDSTDSGDDDYIVIPPYDRTNDDATNDTNHDNDDTNDDDNENVHDNLPDDTVDEGAQEAEAAPDPSTSSPVQEQAKTTRSGRVSKPPKRYQDYVYY